MEKFENVKAVVLPKVINGATGTRIAEVSIDLKEQVNILKEKIRENHGLLLADGSRFGKFVSNKEIEIVEVETGIEAVISGIEYFVSTKFSLSEFNWKTVDIVVSFEFFDKKCGKYEAHPIAEI